MNRPPHAWLWGLVAVQLAILPALAFIDYGWRGPGQFGLRVDHQLLLGAVYGLLWLGGMVWAVRRKAWAALAVQGLAPMLLALWISRPGPTLTVADGRALVGMTRDEAADWLVARRAYWDAESSAEGGGSVLHVRGIDLHLADERRVTRVVPDPDPAAPTPQFPNLAAPDHEDLVGMPYRAAVDSLRSRGGIDDNYVHDESGHTHRFNGLLLGLDGDEVVRRVTRAGG